MAEGSAKIGLLETFTMMRFWEAAAERGTVIRALKVAAFVGTVLVAINQADTILAGQYPPLWQILLTYCVPYCVSTYSAAALNVSIDQDKDVRQKESAIKSPNDG